MPHTEAHKEWLKKNTVMLSFRLQRSTDADILEYLSDKKTQTEVKRALRLLIEIEKQKER